MVTKPVPIYKRWFTTAKGRERAFTLYYVALILLNAIIVLGLIAFILFWMKR